MRLTIEENREAIKRYRHIKPAPLRGSLPCSARCPGTIHTCTLIRGHAGFHVAHGPFKKVVAVWDKGVTTDQPGKRVKKAVRPVPRRQSEGRGALLKSFLTRSLKRAPSLEEVLLLAFSVSMTGFAIHWLIQIFGG